MAPTPRAIAALRKLRGLHSRLGYVPLACLDMLIAELETEADVPLAAPPYEEGRGLSRNPHGYPQGLARP